MSLNVNKENLQELGIYIHIPFCQKKCKYCDFISFDNCNQDVKEKYVNCLIKEIDNYANNEKDINLKNVTTIYFGGGTPSSITVESIKRILDEIKEKFNIKQNAEITIEINPGTVDINKLHMYKDIGITRLSIGLQSTHDRLLELIGRIHKYEDFEKIYFDSRKVGFENINIDLMLGLPTQTIDEIKSSVNKIVSLNPEHISLYSLILEEGTELEKLIKNDELKMIPEDLERKMYWETKQILEKNKYIHYEISNFSKKGFESKHNINCWNQFEYIGFGLAAHSYINKKRFSNTNNLEDYIKNIEENNFEKNIIIQEKYQTFEEESKEYMMLGLRKIKGVSISKFEQKFRINPLFYFRFEISKLEEEGFLEVDLDDIRLTNKGLDFANLVFEEFI